MALVGAESGAEWEEGGGGAVGAGQDRTLCCSWRQRSKVEEGAAAICRIGGWRGGGASGVLIPGTTVAAEGC